MSLPVVNILDGPVIIKVKGLTRIGANPEVKATHSERASLRGHCGMCRAHIERHPSSAGEIVPLGHLFDHAIGARLPGETVRARRRFPADGRRVKVDDNFLTDEM